MVLLMTCQALIREALSNHIPFQAGHALHAGRLKEAEAVINRSLGIRRTMFGAAHPDVASCLHNLGLLLKRRNEFDKAESVYRECIEIRYDAAALHLCGRCGVIWPGGNCVVLPLHW